jgi:hypothetical protein
MHAFEGYTLSTLLPGHHKVKKLLGYTLLCHDVLSKCMGQATMA